MVRLIGICCVSICLFYGDPAAATDESTAAAADVSDPKVRFLLLTPASPILIEASIHLDGQPFRMAHETLAAQLLNTADTNADGKPTWQEAMDNRQFGFGHLMNFARGEMPPEKFLKDIDRNQNGQMEIHEARHLIQEYVAGPAFEAVQGSATYSRSSIKTVLDVTGDGVISQSEWDSAPENLKRHDVNKNGLLETDEVGGGAPQEWVPSHVGEKNPPVISVYRLDTSAKLDAAYRGLLEKYSGSRQAIAPSDIHWFPDFVTLLDLNKNGSFDPEEAIGVRRIQPHLMVDVNLGESVNQPAGIRLVAISKALQNRNRIGTEFLEQVELTLPRLKLTLSAPNYGNALSAYTSSVMRQAFRRFDLNRNGYIGDDDVERTDVEDRPYLVHRIKLWDSNGDGMVFPPEVETYCHNISTPKLNSVYVQAANHQPSFFSALDETGDNRLSAREIRNAPQRLKAYDSDGDGMLTVDELPIVMDLTFQRSFDYYHARKRTAHIFKGATAQNVGWFVKMDTNRDGDLNSREFLGDSDKFKQLDINRDGFIERKEAEAVSAMPPQK